MKLNFYLFKDSISNFNGALSAEHLTGEDPFVDRTNSASELAFEFRVFLQENKQKPPKWTEFIQEYCDEDLRSLNNQVNSFVILVKTHGRFFAITGGYGYNAIDKTKVVSDFGLKCALNAVSADKIKLLDTKNIDINTKQTRVITSKETDSARFGIDFDAEVLKTISGKPTDLEIANFIKGSESVSLSLGSNFDFPDLGNKCTDLLDLYSETSYKDKFGFIDKIITVSDKEILSELDNQLVKKMNEHDVSSLELVFPDQFEAEDFEEMRMTVPNCRRKILPSLTLNEVNKNLIDSVTIEALKKEIRITGFVDNQPKSSAIPLYNLLTMELKFNKKLYLLSDKRWYEVSESYLQEIDQSLSGVEYLENEFPDYLHSDEDDYNDKLAKDKGYKLIHGAQNLIRPTSGSTPIEIADLFDNQNSRLIHVKRYRSSASLSHLFSQADVSISAIFSDDEFRDKAGKVIGELIDPREITVCVAIIDKREGNIIDLMPTFSKINFYNRYKWLKRICKNVQIAKITDRK